MDLLLIIMLAAGAVLLLCSWFARRRQLERRRELEQTLADEWTGSVIDTGSMAPRLQRLRQDYVYEVRQRSSHWAFHDALLAAAREAIARLPFFTERSHHPDRTR